MMTDTYGKSWSGGSWQNDPVTFIEDFDVYDVPMQFDIEDNRSWFLTGIFWDIKDASSDNIAVHRNGSGIYQNNIVDNYTISSGTSLQPLFSKLTGSVATAIALKNSLMGTGSGTAATAGKINELFTSYGY